MSNLSIHECLDIPYHEECEHHDDDDDGDDVYDDDDDGVDIDDDYDASSLFHASLHLQRCETNPNLVNI